MEHFTHPQACGEPSAKYRIIGWAGAVVVSLILWAGIILAGNMVITWLAGWFQ